MGFGFKPSNVSCVGHRAVDLLGVPRAKLDLVRVVGRPPRLLARDLAGRVSHAVWHRGSYGPSAICLVLISNCSGGEQRKRRQSVLWKRPCDLTLGPTGGSLADALSSLLVVLSSPFPGTVSPTSTVAFSVFPGIAPKCGPSPTPPIPLLRQALHPRPLNSTCVDTPSHPRGPRLVPAHACGCVCVGSPARL